MQPTSFSPAHLALFYVCHVLRRLTLPRRSYPRPPPTDGRWRLLFQAGIDVVSGDTHGQTSARVLMPMKTSAAVSLLLSLSATASRSRGRAGVRASFPFRRYEVSMDRVCLESASKRAHSLWHWDTAIAGDSTRFQTQRAPHIISQQQANM